MGINFSEEINDELTTAVSLPEDSGEGYLAGAGAFLGAEGAHAGLGSDELTAVPRAGIAAA